MNLTNLSIQQSPSTVIQSAFRLDLFAMNNNHPDDDGTHKRARPDSAGTGNRTLRPPANRIRYQQPQQPQYHQNSDPLPPLPQPNYYAPPPSYNVHHGNSQPQQQYQPRLFTTYPLSNTNPTMGHNRFNNSVSLGRMMASANSVVGHNEFNNSASIMGGSVGKGGMATEMGAPSEDESMTIFKSKKKSKKPGTSKLKNNDLQSILEGNKEFGGRVLNLYEADKVFIRSWITRFLDRRQADCKAEMEEKARAGDHLQAKTLLKMRAIEACLLDELRPKLIKIFDSWGRGKLDQRNSVDKEWDIFDDAAAK